MGKLILVRHGESTGNRERIFAVKPHELALTELGQEQAREAARKIAALFKPELVVASSFVRARDTAAIIAGFLALPLEIEHDLHERNIGSFMGRPYESMAAAPGYDPQRHWLWKPPGGESFEEVKARAAPIVDRLARAHSGRDVVVVSHGGVMMALWSYFTGSWEDAHVPPNCGIVVVEYAGGRYGKPQIIAEQGGGESTGG